MTQAWPILVDTFSIKLKLKVHVLIYSNEIDMYIIFEYLCG